MNTIFRKVFVTLVLVSAVILFIAPLVVSALTLDEILKDDPTYYWLKWDIRSLDERYNQMEARKAVLMRQYRCDSSGTCKGDPVLDECLAQCTSNRTDCNKSAPQICDKIIDPTRKKDCFNRYDRSCNTEQYEYCTSHCRRSRVVRNENEYYLQYNSKATYDRCVRCETMRYETGGFSVHKAVVDCQHLTNKQKFEECLRRKTVKNYECRMQNLDNCRFSYEYLQDLYRFELNHAWPGGGPY